MAILSITPASVVRVDGQTVPGTAGETITAGQSVYLDTSVNQYKLAQADGTAVQATCTGVALNGAAIGQPIVVQTSGTITIGATVAVGEVYCLADTAGGIGPYGDVGSSDYVSILGVGATVANIALNCHNSGIEKA